MMFEKSARVHRRCSAERFRGGGGGGREQRRRDDCGGHATPCVLLLLREYLVDEDLSGEKNRGIVRNCSIGTMRVEVDTSSSESKSNTRWILDSWGKVDAEGTDVL